MMSTARWAPLRRAGTLQQTGIAYSSLRPRPNLGCLQPARQASHMAKLAHDPSGVPEDLESSAKSQWNSMPQGKLRQREDEFGNRFERNSDTLDENMTKLNQSQSTEVYSDAINTESRTLQFDIHNWPEHMRRPFTEHVRNLETLERCLVWITQQGFRFDSSPVPSWLLLSILRLPAQVDTLLDLCHNVAPQLPDLDVTTRNRLIALFIYRFADHGMITAIEPIYQLRNARSKKTDASDTSIPSTLNTGQLDDQGELAILRALQRLVCKAEASSGSDAQAIVARRLLATHVKQIAGTKSRLLTLPVLNSLYLRKYLSKPLIRALESVRKLRKVDLSVKWKRELFRYAVWHKDYTQSQLLLQQLKEDLATLDGGRERDRIFRTLLGSLRHIDSQSDLYRSILEIQYSFADSELHGGNSRFSTTQEIAQSIRIASSAYSDQIGITEWHDLCRTFPQTGIKQNLAVIMKGYLFRNQAASAWRLWQEYYSSIDLDSVMVTTVMKVLSRLHKVDEAIQLIDACHRLSNSLVDKTVVNELLRICVLSGKLDYVQRIWEEMEGRWHIRPDNVTLGMLLHATQIAPQAQITSFSQLVKRSFFSEISDIKMYDNNTQDPEPEQAESLQGSPAALPDERWWQTPSDAGMWLDWKSGRALFRHILFRNHPFLVGIRSPLERGFASGIGNMVFGHRHHEQQRLAKDGADPEAVLAKLPINSRHKDITYTTDTFHSYMCLLNKHNLGDEMALCLEWMKHLRIQPQRKSLCMVLLKVENSASPKQMRYRAGEQGWHKYALMTDGEWLRDWVVHWLGQKAVPTEEELADFHMQQWNSDRCSDFEKVVQF